MPRPTPIDELGVPIRRSVLANLESGRRSTLSVAELLVLARALGVAPLMLLFPIGAAETIEVLPGEEVPVFAAARWFTGERPWPDGTENAAESWWSGSFPAIAFREHAKLAEDHRFALRGARVSRAGGR